VRAGAAVAARLEVVGDPEDRADRAIRLAGDLAVKVSEGTRTPDRLDHNQELYQLSYAHRVGDRV
jgi:hypothetical protein